MGGTHWVVKFKPQKQVHFNTEVPKKKKKISSNGSIMPVLLRPLVVGIPPGLFENVTVTAFVPGKIFSKQSSELFMHFTSRVRSQDRDR